MKIGNIEITFENRWPEDKKAFKHDLFQFLGALVLVGVDATYAFELSHPTLVQRGAMLGILAVGTRIGTKAGFRMIQEDYRLPETDNEPED